MKEETVKQALRERPVQPEVRLCENTKHPNYMVVVNNQAELNYMCEWNEMNGILPPFIGRRIKYPIAVSPNSGSWTDSMDRALYYVPFVEFIKAVS